jgi:tetratricopeptide (TPR) repeat protein
MERSAITLIKKQNCSSIFFFSFAVGLSLFLNACVLEPARHKIQHWHQLRATGQVSLDKQDYLAAEKSFKEALKIAEEFRNQPVRQAISLADLSRVCMATDNVDLSLAVNAQALTLANKRSQAPKKQSDQLESELAQCLYNTAGVLAKAKKYDQAAIAYSEAKAIFIDLYQRSPVNASNLIIGFYLAQTIDNLGISYKELGQLKAARQAYLTVKEGEIVQGIPYFLKVKLVKDFCQIPDTPRDDKQNYAATLGCTLPQS